MDALLIALIACLASEIGDRSQLLAAALFKRFDRRALVIAGLVVAVAANTAASSYAGHLVGSMLSHDARTLFMALGFLAGGFGMVMPTKKPDMLQGWRIGAFATSALGLLILGFGESAQFLIMGISAARGDALLAAAGGVIGILVACVSAMVAPEICAATRALRIYRRIMAAIFVLTGGTMAVGALGLT
jgi:putative Ca2+/H+ antiporter (TMEM165/GDT1 family)